MSDTIIALASGNGRAGVAIIRLSGANSLNIAQKLCNNKIKTPRFSYYCELTESNEILDKAVVVWFKAPNSFTGEDVIEFHVHGGRIIIQSVISACLNTKLCRLANAGEFSKRAFLNEKLDLTEAEAIADIIDAETTAQAKQAMRQMQGALKSKVNLWRDNLIEILSFIEAHIDFPDEDLPMGLDKMAKEGIISLKLDLAKHIENSKFSERVRDGVKIAIIGPPNAGKSSLLNNFARREVAIVSELAGTTRDIIEISFDLDGQLVWLFDTAGIRESTDIIELEGMKRAIEHAKNADFRIGLIGSAQDFDNIKPHLEKGDILVWSKSDLITPNWQDISDKSIANFDKSAISIKDNSSIETLKSVIKNKIIDFDQGFEASILTRERHRLAVSDALEHLENIDLDNPQPIELLSEDIRFAAYKLGTICGNVSVDDILDQVFSSFCIGK